MRNPLRVKELRDANRWTHINCGNGRMAFMAFLALTILSSRTQSENRPDPIFIDARQEQKAPRELPFAVGGRAPDGHALSANEHHLLLDQKPWFPVMGEFHFSRYAADEWERELLKIKAAGVEIVATYVFWIHHEEIEGYYDWSGQRDLRRFVALCARHGLRSWLRVGPWAHGECRNGGLPDWLLDTGPTRENNTIYLNHVRRFFREIGRQVDGMLWKDGGSIIGVQIENEYHKRGAGRGQEHLLELRRMAQDAGLIAPFYTVTAWGDAVVPERDFLPVFGGYADGFWYRETTERPPSPNYFFTPIRCEENVGDDLRSKDPAIDKRLEPYPYLTAEMGGGMSTAYHRRPVISADDTAAMAVVKIGSGVTLYGYYMFHGGTNPDGKRVTLQESQATNYSNDVTVKSYDFQAPLGEYGQTAPSLRVLRTLHLLLADYGERLAGATPFFPKATPASRADTQTPRIAARIDGERGFVVINNHQRGLPLPDRDDFQARIALPSSVIDVPRRPTTIPSGMYAIWPLNLDLGGTTLEYATAQPICRLADPPTHVFFAWPGVVTEFSFVAHRGVAISAPGNRVTRTAGRVIVDRITPSEREAIRLQGRDGKITRIIVLSRDQALGLWKTPLAGRERLVLSPADLFFEGDRVHLSARDPQALQAAFLPDLKRKISGFRRAGRDGLFARYVAHVQAARFSLDLRPVKDAERAPPVKMGALQVATPPSEEDLNRSAIWSIRAPATAPSGVGRLFLRVVYEGDLARLYAGRRLVSDDFYNGTAWEVGLWRITPEELARGLDLRVMPLRKDAPIYLPQGAWPEFPPSGEVARLKEVKIVPEYERVMDLTR